MHILLIHQVFISPDQGGGTRHYELARFLVEAGHRVTVLASHADYFTGQKKTIGVLPDGMTLRYLKGYRGHNKSIFNRALAFFDFSLRCFFESLRIRDVDVIWGTSPPLFQSISALLAAKIRRKPFVFEVRDLWLDFARELGVVKNPILLGVFKKIEAFLYRFSDHIIVNSPGFIPYIQAIVPHKTIRLFANGVICEEFEIIDSSKKEAFQQALNPQQDFIALYAGNLGQANDIDCILDAAKILKDTPYPIRIVLMGGGMKAAHFKEQAQRNRLDNVTFFSSVPKKDMPSLLPIAHVGIASLKNIPLFATVYPNKVFDYMAAGLPTILSINGVIREVIEASHGGVFIAPGDPQALADAIVMYYRHSDRRLADGTSAKAYVKAHFDRRQIAQALGRFFESLAK